MGLYSLTVACRLLTCSKIIITLNTRIRKHIRDRCFHLLSFDIPSDASINHLVNGTGRRSVPSLKPTLIAIWLPFAAGTGAIAGAVDGPAAADTALEEIVVTGL